MIPLVTIVILFLLPIFIQLGLCFLMENSNLINLLSIALSGMVAPIYLAVISVIIAKKYLKKPLVFILISFAICVICSFISYYDWGMSTGRFYTPDSVTLYIHKIEVCHSALFLAIGLAIAYFTGNR